MEFVCRPPNIASAGVHRVNIAGNLNAARRAYRPDIPVFPRRRNVDQARQQYHYHNEFSSHTLDLFFTHPAAGATVQCALSYCIAFILPYYSQKIKSHIGRIAVGLAKNADRAYSLWSSPELMNIHRSA